MNISSLASLPPEAVRAALAQLSDDECEALIHDWRFIGRDEQIAPDGDWLTWLILAGRGFGKTRTGAEWAREQIKAGEKKNGPAPSGVFKTLPPRLPALMHAEAVWKQIQKRQLPGVQQVDPARIRELGATLTDEELGRRLFELAAAARQRELDPEGALRRMTAQVMHDVEEQAPAAVRPA